MTTNNRLPSGVLYHLVPDDTRTTAQVLADLVSRYHAKTGTWPATVWANPSTLGDYISPDGLTVVGDKRILRNCYLVGPLPEQK